METKLSKKEQRVVSYINDFGSITSMEAISELGDTRLAATIFELKKKGYMINSITETNINRYGEPVHYSRYSFVEERK